MATALKIPRHIGTETGVTIKADLASDLNITEQAINRLDTEHNSNGTHKVVNAASVNAASNITTPKITLPDGTITSSQNIGGTAQTLSAAMSLGKEADLGANDFALTQNGRDLLRIDAQRGLAGMLGNISNPYMDLDMSGIVKNVFVATACTHGAAADVVGFVGLLRTAVVTIPVTAGVSAGMFVEIGGVDYNVTSVVGGAITVEYDSNLTDVAGTTAIFKTWRFKGVYTGKHGFVRSSRRLYINAHTGVMRAMPVGFPCFERGADGSIALSLEPSTKNIIGNPDVFNAIATNSKISPLPVDNAAIGIDGILNMWQIPDTATGSNQRNYAIVADNTSWSVSRFIKKGGTGTIDFGASGIHTRSTLGSVVFDIATGLFSGAGLANALANNALLLEDLGGYWRVGFTFKNNGGGTILIVRTSYSLVKTNMFEGKLQVENVGMTTGFSLGLKNRSFETVTQPAEGNIIDVSKGAASTTVVVDYELLATTYFGEAHIMSTNIHYNHLFRQAADGRVNPYTGLSGASIAVAGSTSNKGAASRLLWSFDHKANVLMIGADGGTTSISHTPAATTSPSVLYIGRWGVAPDRNRCRISRVRVYPLALTQSEAGAA